MLSLPLKVDGKLDTGEWLYIAAAILGAGALTYIATNVPGVYGGAIKSLVAGGGAFVASLIAYYQPDSLLSTSEFLLAAAAAITVLGRDVRDPRSASGEPVGSKLFPGRKMEGAAMPPLLLSA